MKFAITIALFIIAFTLGAQGTQSVTYTIECPAKDSCFLVETSMFAAIKGEPRQSFSINYRFFRTEKDLDLIIEAIRNQANAEISGGVDRSRYLSAIADKILAAKPKNP